MKREYAKLIINNLITKKEFLFITIASSEQEFTAMLVEEAKKKNYNNIFINYYDETSNYKYWMEYIDKDTNFLFIFGDKNFDNLSNKICNSFLAKELDVSYLIVPTYEVLIRIDKNFIMPKSNIDLNVMASQNKKIISKLKDFKINRIIIKSLFDTNLKMEFNGKIENISSGNYRTCFPFIGIKIHPKEKTVFGNFEASSYTNIDGLRIQGIRGTIKNDELVEYDCDNYHKETKEIFNRNKNFKFTSFNLPCVNRAIDSFDNLALININPYIVLKDNDNREINIPIDSRTLTVSAMTDDGKELVLYKASELDKKLLIRK